MMSPDNTCSPPPPKKKKKTRETLPKGVLPEDLQRNDRVKGKPHFGPHKTATTRSARELSIIQQTGVESGSLSNWLQRGAAKFVAHQSKNPGSAFANAVDLAWLTRSEPFFNPCYFNALTQAVLWI